MIEIRRWLRRKRARRLAFLCYVSFLLAISYGAALAFRGARVYRYVKAGGPMLTDGLVEAHPDLGFAPVPNSSGWMIFHAPPQVPFTYDSERCRVGEGAANAGGRPIFLFLGCSYTHGDACAFEVTYAARVAGHFQATPLNRGFCAYGLSQMVLIAQDVIPRLRPTVVFAQYSPWVVSRGMAHFAPTSFARRPQPYFFRGAGGHIRIAAPPYAAYGVQLPAAQYRTTPRGPGDAASFLMRVAVPLFANQDVRWASYLARSVSGRIPPAAEDRADVVRFGYGQIRSLCERQRIPLVVPIIGTPGHEPLDEDVRIIKKLGGLAVVDCWSPLVGRLPHPDRPTYMAAYAHHRGSPPRLVDPHPNAIAHGIIADTLIARMESQALAGEETSEGTATWLGVER